jgi:arylsulfatase A-like enzyme
MAGIKDASLLALTLVGFVNANGQTGNSANKSLGSSKSPNIVLILTDQLRADACKREGFALNTTPFLDNLAETGVWFNRAYCASPACVPSRTSMMTGRFPSATHVRSNMNVKDAYYQTDLMEVLHQKGYQTALIGKNHSYLKPEMVDYWKEYSHLGVNVPRDEKEKAFNKYLEGTHFYMNEKAAPFPASEQLPARIVNDAKTWVTEEQKSGKPFFLYVSIPEPHNPYQVSEPYYSMFPPDELPPVTTTADALPAKGNKWVLQKEMADKGYPDYEKQIPRIRSNYYGMMRLIDDEVKNLVDFLKENKLYENTIFIFVADHGDFTGDYGLIKKGVETPDCLARIPMIWHGPGIKQSKLPHDAHVSNIDIMPTICDIIGTSIPDGVQGRSLWPLLQGEEYPKEEFSSIMVQQGFGGLHFTDFEEYDPYTQDGNISRDKTEFDELNTWSQSGTLRMLRKDDWKLVYDMQGSGQLYDLKSDPMEVHDLFGDARFAATQMDLLQDMMTWELRMQDPLPLPHPNKERKYGFKRDPKNYWAPYKDEPARKLKKNLKNLKK